MSGPQLTVALSSHRVETLAPAEQQVRGHDLVLLEEPADELFRSMLSGQVPIDDYLDEIVPAFPVFARASCELWRRLHDDGLQFMQIDPFQEELGQIHDFFDQGGKPADIPDGTLRRTVYDAERIWTGALVDFYASAARTSFDELVAATLRFARADAARGRLRDGLRATAVARVARSVRRAYVEAGYLHHGLWLELRRRWQAPGDVRAAWLLEPVVRARTGLRQLLSPGDRLTLAYTFRSDREPRRARLWAARSLVYNKIIAKDEAVPGDDDPYPHTTDELETASLVNDLSFVQCEELYRAIRQLPESAARAVARSFGTGAQ